MSTISQLESELERQRSINRELSSELSTISYGVNHAYNRLENFNNAINNALDNSRAHLDESTNNMVAALETQAEIERLYVRFKAMELANKRIRDCNNKKFYDFANYTKVRKLVQGVMDNLDVNMASDRVIYKSVEKQHLKAPDYWLTCVLLSIMAWRNDDKDLADRSIKLAMELDKKSSSVFYMLFNLRMHREEAALRWFDAYQQCELKGSDQRTFLVLFALVSRCINTSEEISDTARQEITDFIRRVVDQSVRAKGYSREAMVDLIVKHLAAFTPKDQPDYSLLRKYCKQYSKYASALNQAKANIPILEFFRESLNMPPEQRNTLIKDYIDELIAAANSQEKGVYEEIEYNETIIRMEGDVDKAKEIFGKKKIHDEREMNLVYEMVEWIFGVDKEDVNGQSRMNMLTLTMDYQRDAVEKRVKAYRAVDRRHSAVEIGAYSATMDFENEQAEKTKADAFFAQLRDEQLASIKDTGAYIGFGVAAVSAVAALMWAGGLFAVTGCAACYGIFALMSNKSKRQQAELDYNSNCRVTGQIISDLCKEYQAYEKEFASFDAYADLILQELENK